MEELDLKEFLVYYIRRIWFILLIVFIMFIIGNFYSLIIKDSLYRSEVTLVLTSSSKDEESSITPNDVQINQNMAATYSELIKSRKVLQEVIQNMSLNYSIEQLRQNISVEAVPNTAIIKIAVTDLNPKLATNIANEVSLIFSDEMEENYDLQNVVIWDKAVIPNNAYNKNVVKENILYFLVGFVLASGIIFIKYYFDTTIKSKEVIEDKLGLVVIGVIPLVEKE